MRIEVALWLLANIVSLVVSSKDFWVTYRVWKWAKRNHISGDLYNLTKRNFRSSLFRFLLAAIFIIAGITLVLVAGSLWIWFLVAGSITLTIDVLWESKYRSRLFYSAQEKSKPPKRRDRGSPCEDESPV